MKKRTWKSMLAASIVACSVVSYLPVAATNMDSVETSGIVEPRYTGIINPLAELSITSDGMAKCAGTVRVTSGYTAIITMELDRLVNGRWNNVATWTSDEETGYMSLVKYKGVTSGYDYKLTVSFEVMDGTGAVVERQSRSTTYIF